MDIDDFQKCLSYLSTNKTKSLVDELIPLIYTLAGAAFAHGISLYSNGKNEKRTIKNKVECCYGEVNEIEKNMKEILLNTVKLMHVLLTKDDKLEISLPRKIGSMYISGLYNDIAHKFSAHQRSAIQSLINKSSYLNEFLTRGGNPKDNQSMYRYSIDLVNMYYTASESTLLCQSIISDKSISVTIDNDYIKSLGADEAHAGSWALIMHNASHGNKTLNLPT